MEKLFIVLLVSILVTSCDFGGDNTSPKNQSKPNTSKPIKAPKEYYERKDSSKKDSSKKKPSVVKDNTTPSSDLTTLQKDSIKNAARNKTSAEKAEIERLKLKIQQLNKQTTVNHLVRSTYNVIHVDVVEGYLYEMYIKELKALKVAHKTEDVLSERYKKFFTVDYCDDRVLEWLDDFADRRIRSDARRMRLNYEKVADPDATGRQIIRHK